MNNFEPYRNPNQSRLEEWRAEITEMRSLNWPYSAIQKWLLNEQQLTISTEAIRQFCKIRNIKKNRTNQDSGYHSSEPVSSSSHTNHQTQKNGKQTFTYKPQPINVYKS